MLVDPYPIRIDPVTGIPITIDNIRCSKNVACAAAAAEIKSE